MIEVTLTNKKNNKISLQYIADGDLFSIHDIAESRVEGLQGLKEGDIMLVRTVETKTGMSINTVVVKGEPCPF